MAGVSPPPGLEAPFASEALHENSVVVGLRGGRRALRHDHVAARTAALRLTLCELDGFPAGQTCAGGEGPLRAGAAQILIDRVALFGSPAQADGTPQEALREIFGGHADYTGDVRSVVPLQLPL